MTDVSDFLCFVFLADSWEMSTVFFLFLSLYRRRIPSGLLFVIHSINVCCLWDLLFAVILCFYVCLIRMFWYVLFWCLPLFLANTYFLTHRCARAHMFCVCVQVVVRFAPPKHVPLLLLLPLLCVWLFCVFKFDQTLTIVPRVALNWYTVFFMSLSLTKLSMENKCGIYVLQNINKNSQVVPKIFWFCIFGFTSAGCKCVFVFVCFKFASYAFWSVGWVDQILVMQVVRVSTTDFGVMRIFNCAKLCQNMFQLRRTIKDFGKWALNQSVAEGLSYYTVFVFTVLL